MNATQQPLTQQPLTEEFVKSWSRSLDLATYPAMTGLSRDDIYDHGRWMAPGGLLLADMLAETLDLQPGQRVLDAGCGRGQSSVLLAERYGVEVISVDLWIPPSERQQRAEAKGVQQLITPLQGNIARGLPIEAGSLDAIFSLQAFHTFGTDPTTVKYLSKLLKPGGLLAIAQGCFRDEPDVLPPLFHETDGWHVEYEKYHSANWWRTHLEASADLEVHRADEIPNGDVLWEDDLLYKGDQAKWSPEFFAQSGWLMRHIHHGITAAPSLTHCLVTARRGVSSTPAEDGQP